MKLKLFLCGVIVSIATTLSAQTINVQKLDQYFETLVQNNKFMGSIAIFKNNQIIYKKAVGFSDVENNKTANTETKYKIGSISKTFTAVLIFKAIEEQKLDLSTKLNAFFPAVKNAEKITIKNLLNHSSGIHSLTSNEDYLTWSTKKIEENELLNKILQGGSDFEPNLKSAYSNSNYVLLSLILEKVFKQPYTKILEKYITKPLKLNNTYFGEAPKTTSNISKSYSFKNSWQPELETHYSIPLGAGGIISTPTDLNIFINALFDKKIIAPVHLNEMTAFVNRFGLGLFDMPYEKHLGIGHDGSIDGYKSMLTIFPSEGISYAITSNASDYNLNLVSKNILSAIFNNTITIPEFKKINFTAEELNRFVGIYSNKDFPFKINITQKNLTLNAQATGQAEFQLEAIEKNIFTFDKAGIKLTFIAEKNVMILNQAGREIELTKE